MVFIFMDFIIKVVYELDPYFIWILLTKIIKN